MTQHKFEITKYIVKRVWQAKPFVMKENGFYYTPDKSGEGVLQIRVGTGIKRKEGFCTL